MDELTAAQRGDREAFAALVAPYQRELQAHCYRMLGSSQDAEDALQETLLAAWVGLPGFEGRSSVRTWLYRIATNRCLNARRASARRNVDPEPLPAGGPAQPLAPSSRSGEVLWLQPYPDAFLGEPADPAPGPDARYESVEAISLAFVTAVQLLPPRQRAVLLLRDVLGFRAREVADMLDLTEEAVTSALKRARATLGERRPDARAATTSSLGTDEAALLDRFVAAFVGQDVDALVALLAEDVEVRMPPLPYEYHGRAAARAFFAAVDGHRRSIAAMVPVGVNRQPAWGEYVRDPGSGTLHLVGLLVAAVRGDRVGELTHFEAGAAVACGLPRTLP